MTCTCLDISAAIKAKGGRYLEAPVSGSKRPAEAGEVNPSIFNFSRISTIL